MIVYGRAGGTDCTDSGHSDPLAVVASTIIAPSHMMVVSIQRQPS